MDKTTLQEHGFQCLLITRNYVAMVGLLILLVAGILGWMAHQRLAAFHEQHQAVARESVAGVEKQVAFYIAEKRRMVDLFVADHLAQVRALAKQPDNDALRDELGRSLRRYFPDYFAFSLTDREGTPLFVDFDGLVSDLCLADIKEFAKDDKTYQPYIHPNAEAYHFDIMVRYGKDKTEGVFFVSFLADTLSNILKNIQSSGHKMMLVYTAHSNIIEVVAEGARNHWPRQDYRLSPEELARISVREDIPGTRWQAVTIQDGNLFSAYKRKLLIESVALFLVFTSIAIVLVVRLRREERQRELAEAQRNNLMNMVTHEFRSPVSIIKSALDLISSNEPGEEVDAGDIREFIDMALHSTSHLLVLVDDFLDLQKIESGNLRFDKQLTQLSSVIRYAVDSNKLYAENFNASYQLIEPLPEQYVLCDEQRIYQVMSNLLTNAAKYGGENDVIEVSVTERGDRLRVSVRDHGPGIPEDFYNKVFEKFAMTYAPKKTQPIKSTGLGLSIAREIIRQHDGEIGFYSEPGKGATFWFDLPIVDPPAEQAG